MRTPVCTPAHRPFITSRFDLFGALALSIAAALTALTGCASGRNGVDAPPPIDTTSAFSELGVDAETASQLGYQLDWRGAPFLSKGEHIAKVKEYKDVVAVLDSAGNLSFLEARTGQYKGNRPVATHSSEFLGLFRSGDTMFVTTESEVFGVNVSSQDLTVRQRLAHIVSTGPVVVGNTLVFGTSSGSIRTHNLTANIPLWSNGVDNPVHHDPMFVGGSAVVVISESGEILTMDPSNGGTMGRAKIFAGAGGTPITGDGLFFIASNDQSLYCFVPGQSQPIWRVRTERPLEFTPTYHQAALYCTVPDRGMTKYDALTGDVLWTKSEVSGTVVAMRRNTILVWNDGGMTLLDADFGDIIREVPIKGVQEIKATEFADGPLLVIGKSGAIARLIPQF